MGIQYEDNCAPQGQSERDTVGPRVKRVRLDNLESDLAGANHGRFGICPWSRNRADFGESLRRLQEELGLETWRSQRWALDDTVPSLCSAEADQAPAEKSWRVKLLCQTVDIGVCTVGEESETPPGCRAPPWRHV
jgi:hypothetical protein